MKFIIMLMWVMTGVMFAFSVAAKPGSLVSETMFLAGTMWQIGGFIVLAIRTAPPKADNLHFHHDLSTGRKWTERVWERRP